MCTPIPELFGTPNVVHSNYFPYFERVYMYIYIYIYTHIYTFYAIHARGNPIFNSRELKVIHTRIIAYGACRNIIAGIRINGTKRKKMKSNLARFTSRWCCVKIIEYARAGVHVALTSKAQVNGSTVLEITVLLRAMYRIWRVSDTWAVYIHQTIIIVDIAMWLVLWMHRFPFNQLFFHLTNN